ncbi:MAG TPA: hypothetical protein VGK08_04525 [Thermoanaerobaculia bacterium]
MEKIQILCNPRSQIRRERLTFAGVSPRRYRARKAEAELRGKTIFDETVTAAATAEFENARLMSGNAYKIPLAAGVLRRAFRRARSRTA